MNPPTGSRFGFFGFILSGYFIRASGVTLKFLIIAAIPNFTFKIANLSVKEVKNA
jgi:hypothetical protein